MATTITGTYHNVLTLNGSNQNPATIAASAVLSDGIQVTFPAAWTVTNYGVITYNVGIRVSYASLILFDGGLVTNAASGLIKDRDGGGVAIVGAAGTVVNAGTIIANGVIKYHPAGVWMSDGGVVSNSAGGVIKGNEYGVQLFGAAGTVINAGTISGYTSTGTAIHLAAGYANRLIVDPGATFVGTVNGGNTIGSSIGSTLELASGSTGGTLTSLGSQFIQFGTVTIDSSARWTLAGSAIAGYTIVDSGTLTNTGTLASAVTLSGGGVFSNAATGTVSVATGVAIDGTGAATVANAGDMIGETYGITLAAGGTVSNATSGYIGGLLGGIRASAATTIVNAGHIYGALPNRYAVDLLKGGTVANLSGGTIGGLSLYGTSTVINAGSIVGSVDAIQIHAGYTDRVVINPGAVFSGTVDGGNTAGGSFVSTLELASGSGAGTLTSLGSKYLHFAAVTVDSGAAWTLTAETIGSSYAITDSGTLTNKGTLGANVVLSGGVLSNASTGRITAVATAITGAGTVVNAGTISASSDAVLFSAGSASRLMVDPGASFSGTLSGGNTIGSSIVSTLELASGSTTGTLTGLGSKYVRFAAITIDSGATWSVSADTIAAGYTLTNSGTLSGGVTLGASGVLSNASGGLITATSAAAVNASQAATVVNAGTIADGAGSGVSLANGGVVTNQSGGRISASLHGVVIAGAAGTITNSGAILAGNKATYLYDGGAVINLAGGTLSGFAGVKFATAASGTVINAGFLYGSNNGVYLRDGGSITNQSGGTISSPGRGVYVNGFGAATVTNAGLISGTTASVKFTAGFADRLIVDPGAAFSGSVYGGNSIGGTIVSTLELASGSTTGTLFGLGSQISRFGAITIDSGAAWVLSADSLGNGYTIADAGTLTNSGTLDIVVSLGSGAVLSNASGGLITATSAGAVYAANIATVVNAGRIADSVAKAVYLNDGGLVSNASSGTLTGQVGVKFGISAPGTVLNAGIIYGANNGIYLRDGGAVINQAGGTISSVNRGVYVNGFGAATVTNAGVISGTIAAVKFTAGFAHRLIVDPGASFSGSIYGGNSIGSGTVSILELASGSTSGTLTSFGSQITRFGNITIDAGAAWTLGAATIGSGYTIKDAGTLTNLASLALTVTLGSGAALTNQSGAKITATGNEAVYGAPAGAGTVVNYGTILDTGTFNGAGVALADGGSLTNQAQALLYGAANGVLASNGAGTVVNDGTLSAGASGIAVHLQGSGFVNNQASGTILDQQGSGVVFQASGTLVNSGTISAQDGVRFQTIGSAANLSGGVITASSLGVLLASGGTLINAGTISGGGDAVDVVSGTLRLIVDPGGVFSGTVDGGNSIGSSNISTLELASGGSAGTLTSLGSQFIRFGNITIDSYAAWTLTSDAIGNGYTIADAGTLTNTGSIGSTVTLANHAMISNVLGASITGGASGVYLYSTDSLINAGLISASSTTGHGVNSQGAADVVSNAASGTIIGSADGVYLANASTLTNAGSIRATGTTGQGVHLGVAGGFVSNASSGTIIGASIGVYLANGDDLTNAGLISATGTAGRGVYTAPAGQVISNASSGTITAATAVYLGFADTLINQGHISGTATGVFGSDDVTVTNEGSISGATDAVLFQAGASRNRLIVDPGASFSGTVDGGNTAGSTIASTLELASGSSAGALSSLGSKYIDFASITIDNGATWSLSSGTVAAGYTVTNLGTLSNGVYGTGGFIGNQSSGLILGVGFGVSFVTGAATLMNAGTIVATGADGTGVYIQSGRVTNQSNGVISGVTGLYALLVTATNAGFIDGTGAAGSGVYSHGGVLTNQSGGTISGAGNGLNIHGGSVTNKAGGIISGATYGVYFGNAVGTLTNAGTIIGSSAAVFMRAGKADRLVVSPGAVFTGGVNGGNSIGSGVVSTLELASGSSAGVLSGLGSQYTHFAAISIDSGAAWTLSSATIGSGYTITDAGTLTNTGSLGSGVTMGGGAVLTNTGTGTINASATAVATGAGATVVNAGRISAATAAVSFAAGAANRMVIDAGASLSGTVNGGNTIGLSVVSTLELASGSGAGTLTGLGSKYTRFGAITIDSGAAWSLASDSVGTGYTITDAGTLTNAGSLGSAITLSNGARFSNAATGTVAATANIALYAAGGVTLLNAGHIAGSTDAVKLHAGYANRLVIDPGAAFSGTIDGGNTIGSSIVSTLELASGSSAGTLTALGSHYVHLAAITIDSGATWTMASAAISGSYTLTDAGTLTNNGSLGSAVTLSGGTFSNLSGGIVGGSTIGVLGTNGAVALVNAGDVVASGLRGFGVYLHSGGSLTNQVSGTIAGYGGAYLAAGGAVNNAGIIVGQETGLYAKQGGVASIQNTGTITSPRYGADLENGTLSNSGLIYGANQALFLSSAGTVTNSGVILQTTSAIFDGAMELAGGLVTNLASGSIVGAGYAIQFANNAATVVNLGSLIATLSGGSGIIIGAGSVAVTNMSSGLITGGAFGVNITDGNSTLSNAGLVKATSSGVGVYSSRGGCINNAASGTIAGGTIGLKVRETIVGHTYSATLLNAGTISGSTDSVQFSAGGPVRLILDPGAVFNGAVDGGNAIGSTIVSTLDLASGSGAGTLAGLGTQYTNFAQITIDSSAAWNLGGNNSLGSGGGVTNAGTLIFNSATLAGAAALTNNGHVILDPSDVTISSLIGVGVVTIEAGSTLEVQGSIASGETILFTGSNGLLVLDTPGAAHGTVGNEGAIGTIDLTGVSPASVSYASGALDFVTNGTSASFPVLGASAVNAVSDGSGGADVTLCFCAGTRIATPGGDVAVEMLQTGDLVLNTRGEPRALVWVGVGQVLVTPRLRSAATPIIVRKGALGDDVPYNDLRVTKGHSFLFDNVLIPAEFLVNHRSILWDERARVVTIYHLELEAHDVLRANGAPAESYRDDGNRWLFRNADERRNVAPQEPCAPVLTGGPIVDAVWRALLDRAGSLAGPGLTDDSDLHLLADGWRIDPTLVWDGRQVFSLPAVPKELRICSRAAAPAELGFARDPRMLGVALRRILLWQGVRLAVIEAVDAALADGFHAYEPDCGWRWTNGDATIPAALLAGFTGPLELEVRIGGSTHYHFDVLRHAA